MMGSFWYVLNEMAKEAVDTVEVRFHLLLLGRNLMSGEADLVAGGFS
jgi:hypothetical protein